MSYRPRHPTASVTYKRPAVASLPGGMERATHTTLTISTPGVEDVTSEVRQRQSGRDVELALRLYEPDVTTTLKEGDLAELTYRGEALTLEVSELVGPFGRDSSRDHVEVTVVSPLKG